MIEPPTRRVRVPGAATDGSISKAIGDKTMFRRKKTDGEDGTVDQALAPENLVAPAKPLSRTPIPVATPAPPPAMARVPTLPPRQIPTEVQRPPAELPRRPTEPGTLQSGVMSTMKQDSDMRQLVVGKEISLVGEINACDRLIVEGSVEANLATCRELIISETGLVKGGATIDLAEIAGRFEGNLTARKKLVIRATGRLVGNVRYGQIEIEAGGQVSGDVQILTEEPPKPSI